MVDIYVSLIVKQAIFEYVNPVKSVPGIHQY